MATKSLPTLRAEIAVLEAQAEQVRKRELSEVVAQIKTQMAMYGVTPADLGFRGAATGSKPTSRVLAAREAAPPKYQDPKTGRTWTGHGKPPNWIVGSKSRDSFLIGAARSPAASSAAAPPAKDSKSKVTKVLATKGTAGTKRAPRTDRQRTMLKNVSNAVGKPKRGRPPGKRQALAVPPPQPETAAAG
jgi:DNA-binding protein H-NS